MKNYKVEVNSKNESKEVQELFEVLGYKKGMCSLGNYPAVIVTTQDWATGNYCSTRALGLDIPAHENYKEITLVELRDMVVLKRNDVNDATHINTVTDSKVLQQGNKNYYWYSGEWHLYPCGVDIRPIEKTMKEYLVKTKDGEYHYINDSYDTCPAYVDKIEIPDGKNVAYIHSHKKYVYFLAKPLSFTNHQCVWQRPTQPEELPFIDDEPTLDKIKIKVDGNLNRAIDIAKSEGYYNCQFNKIPEGAYWLLCNEDGTVDYSMNENILNEYMVLHDGPESINDQYAEIEQFRQHSHYKKDVSNLEFVDVYRVLKLFDVTDPCLQHAIKKLLCGGQRGAKSSDQDVQEAIDSLVRFQQMRIEDTLD